MRYGYVNPLNYPYEYIGVQRQCYAQPTSNIIRFAFMRPRQYYTITSRLLAYYTNSQPVAVAINAPECVRNY